MSDAPRQSTETQQQVITDDVACVNCAYNVRGLPADGRCPECGEEISSTALSSIERALKQMEDRMLRTEATTRRWRDGLIALGILSFVGLFAAALWQPSLRAVSAPIDQSMVLLSILSGAWMLGAYVCNLRLRFASDVRAMRNAPPGICIVHVLNHGRLVQKMNERQSEFMFSTGCGLTVLALLVIVVLLPAFSFASAISAPTLTYLILMALVMTFAALKSRVLLWHGCSIYYYRKRSQPDHASEDNTLSGESAERAP